MTNALIVSIAERCDIELARIDLGRAAAPGGVQHFPQLIRDIAALDTAAFGELVAYRLAKLRRVSSHGFTMYDPDV